MAAPIPRDPPVTSAVLAMISSAMAWFVTWLPVWQPERNNVAQEILCAAADAGHGPAKGHRVPVPPDPCPFTARRSRALDAERDAHAAADAQRGDALPGVAALHLEQERVDHAAARRPDRVADGDGTAVDVDDTGVPAHLLVDGAGLRGEGLVGLHEVEIVDAPPRLFQRLAAGTDRSHAHDRRAG